LNLVFFFHFLHRVKGTCHCDGAEDFTYAKPKARYMGLDCSIPVHPHVILPYYMLVGTQKGGTGHQSNE